MVELVPGIEMVRMVNSGTEAVMSAIRLARGATGRDKIIKFEGCYHGHSDCLLVAAGSSALAGGHPSSAGVPEDIVKHTLTAQFNDLASVEALLDALAGTRWPASSSSLWPPTWAWWGPRRAFWKDCGSCATRAERCWCSTRLSPVSVWPWAVPRPTTACRRIWSPSARSSAEACRWAPTAAAGL